MTFFNELTSSNSNLSSVFNDFASEFGVTPDTAKYCLELALRKCMCKHFNVQECDVDLDAGTVTPLFQVEDGSGLFYPITFYERGYFRDKWDFARTMVHHDYTVPGDLFPVEFELPNLKDAIRAYFEDLYFDFTGLLTRAFRRNLEKKWIKKVHQAVEGVILSTKDPDYILVALDDHHVCGIFPKNHWTPLEVPSYREGKVLLFYVLKLYDDFPPNVIAYLSRGSIGLPGAILKKLAPWVKVKTIKRIQGRKTWLRVTPPVPRSLLKEVSTKFSGEVIEVVNGQQNRPAQ